MGFLSAFVENMFFQTDAQRYWQPEHYGLTGIPFTAENTDGRKLDAIVLPAQPKDGKPLDKTVIYCNPGVFNREFNLPQVAYLAQKGFTVVLFDYSGFGISSGKTTIDGLLTDVETVIEWLDRSDYARSQYVLLGQGVGCDAALQFAHAHPKRVEKLILESAYANRRHWSKERWGPVIGDIAARVLKCKAVEPEDVLAATKIPTVLIFPEQDNFARKGQKKRLEAVAPKSTQIWSLPDARYLGTFGGRPTVWHDAVASFIAGSKDGKSGKTGKGKKRQATV